MSRLWKKEELEEFKELWETEYSLDVIINKFPKRSKQAFRLIASRYNIKRLSRPVRPKVKEMKINRDDAIYLAAFLDADGTIGLHKMKQTDRAVPRIAYINTKLSIIQWIKDTIKIGGIRTSKGGKRTEGGRRCKPNYQWQLNSQDGCYMFLKVIYPFLKLKKRQAEIVMEWIDINYLKPRNEEYSKKHNELINEIKELNKKGLDD